MYRCRKCLTRVDVFKYYWPFEAMYKIIHREDRYNSSDLEMEYFAWNFWCQDRFLIKKEAMQDSIYKDNLFHRFFLYYCNLIIAMNCAKAL